jgi:hypothetical protein
MLTRAVTEVVKWTLVPEAGIAELAVSLSSWLYTVTADMLAYFNSASGAGAADAS